MYQKFSLSTGKDVGSPTALPPELVGLDDATLLDLSWVGEPLRAAYATFGFKPVADVPPEPAPAVLSKLQFIGLAQMAGGMTDAMLVTAQADPNFAAFWIKFQMAGSVECEDPTTAAALGALEAAGYLPEGIDAVLSAWPKV